MKTVSILIPTYNEEDNIRPLCTAIVAIFKDKLPEYDYEIVVIDNFSKDRTRAILTELCSENKKIKAIFNARNFGQIRSPFHGLLQTTGDCTVAMSADFQDPPDMIEQFVREWENGFRIVVATKNKSRESFVLHGIRSMYYKLIEKIADIDHIAHFTGFGLYDKQFVQVLRELSDPMPYMRGIVAELGFERKEIKFTQAKRAAGITKNNFFSLYDYAMLGITTYSKVLMRLATISGFIISGLSFLVAMTYVVLKLIYWDAFPMGIAPIIISIFFLGSLQLFFIGFLGEYILNINTRTIHRPHVVEDKRINFSNPSDSERS